MSTYQSKVDLWLMCFIATVLMLPLLLALFLGESLWPAILACALVVAFSLWLYTATKYIVTKDKVTICAGLYTVNIPLKAITSVKKSQDPISSPAFSLDRLHIAYGDGKSILISPKHQDRFLAEIGWRDA